MARYGLVWVEIAREQYATLPPEAREQVDARIEQLLENQARSRGRPTTTPPISGRRPTPQARD
jgi:hypothetical protein